MQLRKTRYFLLPFILIFLFISCKKETDSPGSHAPKIKQLWAGNDIRTYTYDNKGRVSKIVYALYGRHEYAYTDTGIVVNFYDTTNAWQNKQVYKLDAHGRAISQTSSSSTYDVNTYTYTAGGQMLTAITTRTIPGDPVRTWDYHYYYTNGNLDSVIRSYTAGGPASYSSDYFDEYYPGILNTLGNDNYGQSFLGVSSKNALKAARDIGIGSGGVQPQTTYDYEFDELNNITVQHRHLGTSSFADINFSYY